MENKLKTKLLGMYRATFTIENVGTLDILLPHIPRIGDELDLKVDGFSGTYKITTVRLTAYDGLAYTTVKRDNIEISVWGEKIDWGRKS